MPSVEVTVASASDIARLAADEVEAQLRANARAVIGLASGATQVPIYDELVRRYTHRNLRFGDATIVLLDEYVGLDADHPGSLHRWMREHFLDRVDQPRRVIALDGAAHDLARACDGYEAAIAGAGGIDLQTLGIGRNGHIAFNEPPSSSTSRARLTTLSDTTRDDNASMFGEGVVPTYAVTAGVGTILDASRVVLIATGHSKAAAIARAVNGEITDDCPASALQRHPNVLFLLDEGAASRL